jgi:hypothetical protein
MADRIIDPYRGLRHSRHIIQTGTGGRRQMPFSGQRLRPLVHMRRPHRDGYSSVNSVKRCTKRPRPTIVSCSPTFLAGATASGFGRATVTVQSGSAGR